MSNSGKNGRWQRLRHNFKSHSINVSMSLSEGAKNEYVQTDQWNAGQERNPLNPMDIRAGQLSLLRCGVVNGPWVTAAVPGRECRRNSHHSRILIGCLHPDGNSHCYDSPVTGPEVSSKSMAKHRRRQHHDGGSSLVTDFWSVTNRLLPLLQRDRNCIDCLHCLVRM